MSDDSRHIPAESYAARLTSARDALADRGLGAILIGVEDRRKIEFIRCQIDSSASNSRCASSFACAAS